MIQELNLNIQRINFESKNMQSSYAINNPYMPPMASPAAHKAQRLNELIENVLS